MTDAPPPPPPPNYGPPPQQPYGPPPGYKLKRKKRFYQRFWLFWVPVIIVVIIIASVSASAGGGNGSNQAGSSTNPGTSTTPQPGVSKGIGSKDASADVKLGKLKAKKILGQVSYYYVPVAVTNHSSKRSDYLITVALESADGKRQIDTASLLIQNLEPGQSKSDEGDFLTTDKVPHGTKLVLQEVERTASV
jgi:hypothetical protein